MIYLNTSYRQKKRFMIRETYALVNFAYYDFSFWEDVPLGSVRFDIYVEYSQHVSCYIYSAMPFSL